MGCINILKTVEGYMVNNECLIVICVALSVVNFCFMQGLRDRLICPVMIHSGDKAPE